MMRFELGQVVMTGGALQYLIKKKVSERIFVSRHHNGDWGDLGQEDKDANERAIVEGTRILSAYVVDGTKLYVITEADRSYTTVLLASEY